MALISGGSNNLTRDDGPVPLSTPITGTRATGIDKVDEYPVFGEMNLPDPSKYSSAMNDAFKNFSGTLGNMWGEMKGMMKPSESAGVSGTDPRPVNYGFTETESPMGGGDSGPSDNSVQWHGSPWMHLGSKNGMNQFQRTMGGLASSRMKKSGLY